MGRYSKTKISRRSLLPRDKKSVNVYLTTYHDPIRELNDDIHLISTEGDRLDTLAHSYYGDNTLWWIIAKANGIRGKIGLEVATPLRIPGNITTIIEKFRHINKRG
mgnify:CR=1 FL=1